MKNLLHFLQVMAVIFTMLSAMLLVLSLIEFLSFNPTVGLLESVNNIYYAISKYSDLYSFTFVVLAFWATLRQLQLSQDSNQAALEQLRLNQLDIIHKTEKEINDSTLEKANFYLSDLQNSFKTIIENCPNGMLMTWSNIRVFDANELLIKYPPIHSKLHDLDRRNKNIILLELYRFEAFAALFIYGNLNHTLGKQIIGETFVRQMTILIGIICLFRENADSVFARSILKLRSEWSSEINSQENRL